MPPRRPWRLFRGCSALPALLLCLAAAFAAPARAALDVRVLVDLSHSAQRSDADHARPAMLRLLIDLLPAGSRAGIWAYGERAEILAPPGTVTPAWRDAARRAVASLDPSAASYADLAAGLDAATASWRGGVPIPAERHVILLGDGRIDLPDSRAAETARDRIVRELLPQLQEAGAAVHAVALSANADRTLLAQLIAATDGQRASVGDAESPESTLLRLYERAMRPLLLPTHGNEIPVDGDVRELAVLALTREESSGLRLLTPAGDEPEGARRHTASGHEVIVVADPAPGTWRFEGAAAQDVRALILSDLSLAAGPLPARVLAGNGIELRAGLLAFGRVVDRNALRHALRLEITHPGPDGLPEQAMLLDNGRDGDANAGDGVYTLQLPTGLPAGDHDIRVEADGTIFERMRHLSVEAVANPVTMVFERTEQAATLHVLPYAGLVRPESLQAAVTVTAGGEYAGRYRAVRHAPNEWRIDLSDFTGQGPYELALEVRAERLQGSELLYREAPRRFGPAGLEEPRITTETAPAEESRQSTPDRQRTGLAILLGNAAFGTLLLAGFLFRRLLAGRRARTTSEPVSDLTPEAAPESVPVYTQAIAAEVEPVPASVENPGTEVAAAMAETTETAESDTPKPVGTDAHVVMAEIAADAAAEANAKLREKVERATRSAGASDPSGDPMFEIDISEIDLDFDFDEGVREAV